MKIVVLCDLHFGPSKNNENIYNSLLQVVYPYLLNNSSFPLNVFSVLKCDQ